MAIAATWTMSTARSPTTWQSDILEVLRSAISLQKPTLVPVDDRARRRVEPYPRANDILCSTSVCFGEADLGIFRVREAAGWTHAVTKQHDRAANDVRSRYEAVLHRLGDEHQVTDHV